MNAGVDAARAGEAGKGFASVAQKVRGLAQRSANEVATGARYVGETGATLMEISQKIVEISSQVDLIARSAREQSVSLQEVNASVSSIDQMTQRNAAMVEETNAATRQLAEEADMLMELFGRFRLGDDEAGKYWSASPDAINSKTARKAAPGNLLSGRCFYFIQLSNIVCELLSIEVYLFYIRRRTRQCSRFFHGNVQLP